MALTDRCAPLVIAGKQAQLLHAQADGGARRELPRAEAHERLGNTAMRNEQPKRAKEEEYANVRLLLHATPAHSRPTTTVMKVCHDYCTTTRKRHTHTHTHMRWCSVCGSRSMLVCRLTTHTHTDTRTRT